MATRRFLGRLRRRALRRRAGRSALELGRNLDDRGEQRAHEVVGRLLQRHDTTTQQRDLAALADAYAAFSDRGRVRFLAMLARDFWTDAGAVDRAVAARASAADEAERRAADRALRATLTPPATRLLRLLTGLDDGVKLVVDLRADELRLAQDPALEPVDAVALADVDVELKTQLAALFDVGLLELRRITWEAPAALLERLIQYEAVHAIGSWSDLKDRLDSDRRCYAFFHPAMPSEPLVFVEIALTTGMPAVLAPLLDVHAPELDPEHADTAVFYSISNCQPGLAGVNLGTALIKQVVEELRHDLPHLHRFVTLSPIPGFRAWLEAALRDGSLSERERGMLPAAPARVIERLAGGEWDADEAIEPALVALCARYLTTRIEGRVLDPVANFHLSNGATIERVNWLADPSATGRDRACGLMANYLYEPDRIAARADAYASNGEVSMSGAVRELLG